MTHVDFHFNLPNKLEYACRLARKVYAAKQNLVVYCADSARLSDFDKLLWRFSPIDFIPHVWVTDPLAAQTPIVLTHQAGDTPHHDNLLNLGDDSPTFFSRFERLLELVENNDADREIGRTRFKFYRERGYPMTSHDVSAHTARPAEIG